MAKAKEEKQEKILTPEEVTASFFKHKDRAQHHYNFEESVNYKVKASSLLLTSFMDGGLAPGAHRFMGVAESGKTSSALDFMFHFLSEPTKRRGIYVKSEGRLSENVIARSGVKFVYSPEEWTDGTCFVVESNVYDFVFDYINHLVANNESKTKYFFIIDSMDTMIKASDLEKQTKDALGVASGAVLTSAFLKKASIALSKRGHICVFISQYRETISADRGPVAPRQGSASGGHAIEHAGNWAFEFLKPRAGNDGDVIRESEAKDAKPIGHWCRMKTHKSPNEKTNQTITYPVKYGRTNAKSVWIEYELVDLLIMYQKVERAGAWMKNSQGLMDDVKKATEVELPKQIQGIDNYYKFLEANPKVTQYLFDMFLEVIAK